jgi:hypothetical protein
MTEKIIGDLKGTGWKITDWSNLDQDKEQCQVL